MKTNNNAASPALERGLGLKEAVALNMIEIVGIGPFVVSSLVIRAMGGPQALIAWLAGALLATLDAFVWSELGAAMPKAGGTYVFLREAYGPERWGRLMSFLFVWQTLVQAPLSVASASIGFAKYAGYLYPFTPLQAKAISGGLVIFIVILLYRRIATIGKISVLLWIGVVGTMLWLIWGGATHFNAKIAFDFPPGAFDLSWVWFAGLGSAMVSTIYSYWGYYNICHLGSEIKDPEKNIPRGIFLSVLGIAVLYLAMQTSLLGVVPWREAQNSDFIASLFVERLYGQAAARFVTGMILWIAVASAFSVLLGASRVPYSAAQDGNFFPVFGKVHPTKHFPHVSLLVLAGLALVFSVSLKLKAPCAVHRPGGGRDFAAAAPGHARPAIQNVALSSARGADDDRLGVALLADWADAKMGIGGNRAGGSGVSGSRAGSETMALWKFAVGSCRFIVRILGCSSVEVA